MDDKWVLQDSRSHCGDSMLFWAKECYGYTTNLDDALVLTIEEAFEQHKNRSSDIPWPLSYLKNKTSQVVNVQNVDRSEVFYQYEESIINIK